MWMLGEASILVAGPFKDRKIHVHLVRLGPRGHVEDFESTLHLLWEALTGGGDGIEAGSVWLHGGWTHRER